MYEHEWDSLQSFPMPLDVWAEMLALGFDPSEQTEDVGYDEDE